MTENNGDQYSLNFNEPEPNRKKKRKKPPLLDPQKAREVTEDAIFRAEFLSDDHHKILMCQAIRDCAQQHQYFLADQVWEILGEVGDSERDDGSGLGPMLLLCSHSGLIEGTGTFRRSNRPTTHRKPLPVWKSLIFKGEQA